MKASEALAKIYKFHLRGGHKEAMNMVAIVLSNVIDDIDVDGHPVTPEAIEKGLTEKARIHSDDTSKDVA